MARRDKYGILPKPPVARGTVVKLRSGRNGVATNKRGIVMANVKADAFSRAYGRQVYVCVFDGKKSTRRIDVYERGAHDLISVGKVKKIPKACREAMKEHKR